MAVVLLTTGEEVVVLGLKFVPPGLFGLGFFTRGRFGLVELFPLGPFGLWLFLPGPFGRRLFLPGPFGL